MKWFGIENVTGRIIFEFIKINLDGIYMTLYDTSVNVIIVTFFVGLGEEMSRRVTDG